ncbi:MAG: MFS transporter [Actinobacteria bacterium]|nr:MFS transporter [Actinomycetota bacterium]
MKEALGGAVRERSEGRGGRFFGLEYKWSALSCTSLGALLATINNGTLIIALPELARSLNTDVFSLVWVLLSYMLAQTALVLMVGRFADMIGRKKLYVGGFALFTVMSLVGGFATNAWELILVRTVMGAAGAFMMANSGVIVTDAFPGKQLGQALGINQMVAAVGSILGPVLGGWLISFSWPWIFWFNVPLGIVGTLWAALNLRELVDLEKGQRLDIMGNATLLVGLTALLIGLTQGGIRGWGTGTVVASLIAAAVLLPAFVIVELKAKEPLLNLRMFRSRIFAFGNVSALLNSMARMAVTFLFVFYFIGAKGYDHLTTGFLLTPLAGAMFVFAPLAGGLADRASARMLGSVGMMVTAAGLLGMSTVEVETPYWEIALWMAVIGAGSGIFNSPNTRAIMGSVAPEKRGVASGARTLLVNVGMVLSIAFAIAMVTSAMPADKMVEIFSGVTRGLSEGAAVPFISGLHTALLFMAGVSIVGAAFSALRGSEYDARQAKATGP